MPEKFKVKISMPGGTQKVPFKRRTTLDEVILWINSQNYDDYTKEELIKMLKSYPYTIYEKFRKNINHQLEKVNRKRNKELNEKGIKESNSKTKEENIEQKFD